MFVTGAISELILWSLLALSMDCTPVPVPADESDRIITTALESRPFELQGIDFESHSVKKCISKYRATEEQSQDRRYEGLSFYGVFPHIVRTDDYRERHAIRCSISSDWLANEKTEEYDYCSVTLDRYLTYDDFDEEVLLRDSILREDAEAFLSYLGGFTATERGKGILLEDFRKIQWIDVRGSNGQFTITASWTTGCYTTKYSATAIKAPDLRFSDFTENLSSC